MASAGTRRSHYASFCTMKNSLSIVLLGFLFAISGCVNFSESGRTSVSDVSTRIVLPDSPSSQPEMKYVIVGLISAKGRYWQMPERELLAKLQTGSVRGHASFTDPIVLDSAFRGTYAHWSPHRTVRRFTTTTSGKSTSVSPEYESIACGIEVAVRPGPEDSRVADILARVPTWEKTKFKGGLQLENPWELKIGYPIDLVTSGWKVLSAQRDPDHTRAGTWIIVAYVR